MSRLTFLVLLATAVPLVLSHFTFVRVSKNGEWQEPTRYWRNETSPWNETFPYPGSKNDYLRSFAYPHYVYDAPNSIRCGRDNMGHAPETETLKLNAGDAVGFAHQSYDPQGWTPNQWNCRDGRGSCDPDSAAYRDDHGDYMSFVHPGPVIVHLSKVPEGQIIHTYDGSGEWVKIFTMGLEWHANDTEPLYWRAYNDGKQPPLIAATLPKQTPAGQYLMRIDYVYTGFRYPADKYPHVIAQHYPSCLQIDVTSDVTGDLPKGVKIPEILMPDQPGMMPSLDQYNRKTVDKDYVYPGGRLWDGEKLVEDKPFV